ncbi:replicative DNA helicase [Saccharopolyspora cebuensis]|uniref:replicative DNA helicase n=1 Tax=Saccharopolyspora cebuensis TaxID=418759 RepID=UPI0031EE8EAD
MSAPIIDRDDPQYHQDPGPMPQQDIPAEQSVLGAMMFSAEIIPDVVDQLRAEHFYRPAHQAIYQAICDLYERGEPADAITVASELTRRREIVKIGDAPYLHTLLASVPTAANAGYYAEKVLDAADLRQTGEAGSAITSYAAVPGADAEHVLERAHARLQEAIEFRSRSGTSGSLLGGLLPSTLDELQAIEAGEQRGISTGFLDLDALTTGFHPGQMITVAARPGLGKSSLAMDFARSAALRQNLGVVMFSLEMSHSELTMRLLAAETQVRLDAMRGGRMSDQDWTRVARRVADLDDAPLVIDDNAALTPTELAARARKWKRTLAARGTELGLVIVDYLQLMTSSARRTENRQQEVSDISRSVKLLAKDLGVPVVALSQLNRDAEKRPDKRPQIADLRESGSLEQDSDLVILIHRPDAFERDDPRMGEADLILAKSRSGPTGTVTVAHQLHYSRFVDMAHPD